VSESDSIIVLCPGQGAQKVGMGQAWAARSKAAAKVYEQADQALGIELSKLSFQGPEDQLNRTDVTQAALYTAGVACFRALIEENLIDPSQVTVSAGLSLGEFTALHLAGALSFDDGLKLVRLRGQAMQDAAEAVESSMVALIGADEPKANALCEAAREDGVLVPANFNAPGQVVISGSKDACDRAVDKAGEFELVAKPLVVAGAFHSPLMQPAADRLSQALDQAEWSALQKIVISNVTAQPHDGDDVDSIKRLLVEQLTHPVRWSDSMLWIMENMPGRYIEVAPNKVLSGLMRRINRKIRVENFSEPAKVSS